MSQMVGATRCGTAEQQEAAVVSGPLTPACEQGTHPVRWVSRVRRGDRGMISAEWAVGILAAIALAGVLVAVVTDGAVSDAILKFLINVIKTFASYAAQ